MPRAFEVIQRMPQWDVIDSSKLKEYMECPRKYFFRHVLGWESSFPNNHLTFGTAWHLATEHLLREQYSPRSVEEAKLIFLMRYREDFDADTDELYRPKDAENALSSLGSYARKFAVDVHNYDLIKTEIGGMVMISPTLMMHFKMDALMRNKRSGKILFIDQKTSQRKYSNWGDHWTFSTQMLTYYHALRCLYPIDEIADCKIRCSFFYKAQPSTFEEHPLNKTNDQMQVWLERTNNWYTDLLYNMELLEECEVEERVLRAFPQNDTACFNYGTQCKYWDFCNAWSNPLARCEDVPLGFVRKFWDPRENDSIREEVGIIGVQLDKEAK